MWFIIIIFVLAFGSSLLANRVCFYDVSTCTEHFLFIVFSCTVFRSIDYHQKILVVHSDLLDRWQYTDNAEKRVPANQPRVSPTFCVWNYVCRRNNTTQYFVVNIAAASHLFTFDLFTFLPHRNALIPCRQILAELDLSPWRFQS